MGMRDADGHPGLREVDILSGRGPGRPRGGGGRSRTKLHRQRERF